MNVFALITMLSVIALFTSIAAEQDRRCKMKPYPNRVHYKMVYTYYNGYCQSYPVVRNSRPYGNQFASSSDCVRSCKSADEKERQCEMEAFPNQIRAKMVSTFAYGLCQSYPVDSHARPYGNQFASYNDCVRSCNVK